MMSSEASRESGVSVFPEPVVWSPPPADFNLSPDEVHVWRASLVPDREGVEGLEALLAPQERLRANQFAFAIDRDRFIAGRAVLRQLLGAYLGLPPGKLIFEYGAHGKPAQRTKASYGRIHFNLSHAQNMILYAFACERELGIDLEMIQPEFAAYEVAEHFFSAHELSELRALPPEGLAKGFFTCWTSKEAYVKARGYGLTVPLNRFDTSFISGRPKQLESADHKKWKLYPFEPGPEFVAAVVVEGDDCRMRHFDWVAAPPECLVGIAADGQTRRHRQGRASMHNTT
jgi:4'-phosphopantetheinyl transferase